LRAKALRESSAKRAIDCRYAPSEDPADFIFSNRGENIDRQFVRM
jgi:hypothetical protein